MLVHNTKLPKRSDAKTSNKSNPKGKRVQAKGHRRVYPPLYECTPTEQWHLPALTKSQNADYMTCSCRNCRGGEKRCQSRWLAPPTPREGHGHQHDNASRAGSRLYMDHAHIDNSTARLNDSCGDEGLHGYTMRLNTPTNQRQRERQFSPMSAVCRDSTPSPDLPDTHQLPPTLPPMAIVKPCIFPSINHDSLVGQCHGSKQH